MKATISGVKIKAVCAVVPDHIQKYEDDLKLFPFSEHSSVRLGQVMGFIEHRITDPKTTLVDLAAYGLSYFLEKNIVKKEEIDAVIFVAQQHDHVVPGNSKVLHGFLGLSKDTHCIDMYENCIGFISGLYTACNLIKGSGFKKVIVIASDGGSCYSNVKDRNTYPLSGDAAGIALVTDSDVADDNISFIFHHDGSLRESLIVPAGGMRMPTTAETLEVKKDEMGNYRSLNNLYMDGTAVFHFVMEKVPEIINEICAYTGISKDKIDYYLTHQPNRFMLEKLADLMNVSRDKLFNNIGVYFGNSSSATIPVDMAYNLGDKLDNNKYLVCLAAFGAGMSLATALCNLGNLDCCDLIEHPGNACHQYK